MDTSERFDRVRAILQNTHDGDDLSPFELWIVQEMVNGNLNQKGIDRFNQIYQERVGR